MTDTERVIRGFAPPAVLENYASNEMHAVMVRRHPVGEITLPVLVITLTSDGHIPEALVERVARAIASDTTVRAGHSFTLARAALQSLVPSETP